MFFDFCNYFPLTTKITRTGSTSTKNSTFMLSFCYKTFVVSSSTISKKEKQFKFRMHTELLHKPTYVLTSYINFVQHFFMSIRGNLNNKVVFNFFACFIALYIQIIETKLCFYIPHNAHTTRAPTCSLTLLLEFLFS